MGDNAGLHMLVELQTKLTEEEVDACARKQGVRIFPLSEYRLFHASAEKRPPTFLMGYGCLTEEGMKEGIERLRQILK